jgi:peptide/nickel transport system substrate-binding protein
VASPAAQAPKYGGTVNQALNADVTTWDDPVAGGPTVAGYIMAEELWGGDWAKGPAGGVGTKETDWGIPGYDTFSNKAGYIAESWQIKPDVEKGEGTIIYNIRSGVRYAPIPGSDIHKLIGDKREVTVEDVIGTIKEDTTDNRGYIFRGYPELRNKVNAVQTGPMQVTIKVPIADLVTTVSALGDKLRIYPVETWKVENTNWRNHVGTGPFMISDYVSGSSITLKKNANYWMKDPVGPGKGNQLPYLDGVNFFIIPDASTRLTAFRTGKIDQTVNLTWEDAEQLKKQVPQALTAEGGYYTSQPAFMRTDKAPYSDIRVRRALTIGTDFNSIKQSINGGRGIIITYPWEYYKELADLYVGVDDPDVTPAIKELYTYNPTKAKQLLAEAGFPNGFKTSIIIPPADTSYYEMIAGMWSKIGVEVSLDIKDPPSLSKAVDALAYDHMVSGPGKGPVTTYYVGSSITGAPGFANTSFIKDQRIDETLAKIRVLAITNEKEGFKMGRELEKYMIEQCYAIPRPSYRTSTFWWPWLKNYSGEISVGFFNGPNWTTWVWLDQDQKKSMGF